MAKVTEVIDEDDTKEYLFNEEVQELLSRVQEMLAAKGEISTDDVLVFFANLSMNLVINAKVCSACFIGLVKEIDEKAAEKGLTVSHDETDNNKRGETWH